MRVEPEIHERALAHDLAQAASVPEPIAAAAVEPSAPVAPPAVATGSPEMNLPAIADLCTRLAQVVDAAQVRPLLEDAARILDAAGMIVWGWDDRSAALAPLLAHGYSDAVVASLPIVHTDEENAIASGYRAAALRVVNGTEGTTGAVVTPLLTPAGCSGVLAVELRNGGEHRDCVRAVAAIFAAQLATLFAPPPLAEVVNA